MDKIIQELKDANTNVINTIKSKTVFAWLYIGVIAWSMINGFFSSGSFFGGIIGAILGGIRIYIIYVIVTAVINHYRNK